MFREILAPSPHFTSSFSLLQVSVKTLYSEKLPPPASPRISTPNGLLTSQGRFHRALAFTLLVVCCVLFVRNGGDLSLSFQSLGNGRKIRISLLDDKGRNEDLDQWT